MTMLVVRGAVAIFSILLIAWGLQAIAAGDVGAWLWLLIGVGGLLAVIFERVRYRSDAAERSRVLLEKPEDDAAPAPPFQPTDELFVDPTTRRKMRVYVDPATGERRYHAEA